MNLFKLRMVSWNLAKAMNRYSYEGWCHVYCINENDKLDGCKLDISLLGNGCPFGSHSLNLREMIQDVDEQKENFVAARFTCLYLMYLKKYNTKYWRLFYWYGQILEKYSQPSKALKYYSKACNICDSRSEVHYRIAFINKNTFKNYEKAKFHYRIALLFDRSNAQLCCSIAECILLMEDKRSYRESLRVCNMACKLEPKNVEAHCWRSRTLYHLGRFVESIEESLVALNLINTGTPIPEIVTQLQVTIESCISRGWDLNQECDVKVVKWLFDHDLLSIKKMIKNEPTTWLKSLNQLISSSENNNNNSNLIKKQGNSMVHGRQCKALCILRRFDESIEQGIMALDLNKKDKKLSKLFMDEIGKSMELSLKHCDVEISTQQQRSQWIEWLILNQKQYKLKGPWDAVLHHADIEVEYQAVISVSTKNKWLFDKVLKRHIQQQGVNWKNSGIRFAQKQNKNGLTPAQEALNKGLFDLYEMLCDYTGQHIEIEDILSGNCTTINDFIIKTTIIRFMKRCRINNLKQFRKKIDWDTLKKVAIKKCAFLRDICENGINKKNWVYICIRLDYNLDEAIANAKKIPNLLIKLDSKNTDKENLSLERKHHLKKTKKINDWYVGKIIGKGAFGQVKMGIDNKGRRVALKFIDIDAIDKKRIQLITFIAGEISNIQKIDHENVIDLLAFNLNVDNKIMLVFEYAIYGELYQVIKQGKNKRVNFEMAKHILTQILSALNECHSLGIIHRDIKPQNILVTRKYKNLTKNANEFEVVTKIADFGLSAVTDSLAESKQLVFVGTRGYMSPEIASPHAIVNKSSNVNINSAIISGACDIFSAGVILWQMVYGIDSMPFDEARENDSKYHYIVVNNENLFWKCHPGIKKIDAKMSKSKVLVKEIKKLFFSLFAFDHSKRITIDEIYNHKWYQTVGNMSGKEFTTAIKPYVITDKTTNNTRNGRNGRTRKLRSRGQSTSTMTNPSTLGVTSTWLSHAQLVCAI